MNTTRVLALLPLFVMLAHSFPWDIVVGKEKRLEFFNNGTVTHTEHIPSANYITAITYDPVHFRVLFVNYDDVEVSIYSFDLTMRKTQTIVKRQASLRFYVSLAYDPVRQLLFWTEDKNILSMSLKDASFNETADGNLIVTMDFFCKAIAVDSCKGNIYWITVGKIERAAFDGSKRRGVIYGHYYGRRGLVIDQQTEKMYWIEEIQAYKHSIESADLNGNNRRRFHFIGRESYASSLAVSKDLIYWRSSDQKVILHLSKNQQDGVAPVAYSQSSTHCEWCQLSAANYTIEEQTLGNKSCEALKSLTLDVEQSHGSKCHNYCFQGNCSVSAEGNPKCSCKAGYSGKRCEVNACYMYCLNNGVCSLNEVGKPVCQCTVDYEGERCDVSICNDYCLEGNCSISTEGQRTCRCNAGYFGERCEVNACHEHCLNNGNCSLNENDKPVCQCPALFEGERCDVATTHTDVHADAMTQRMLRDLRNEVKQVIREELQCTLQLYSDKLDENAAKIKKCEESMKLDLQNHDVTTSKSQTSN